MIESLEALIALMQNAGVSRIYAKKLAPNDNSKNQVYLGGDFSVLNIIPHGKVRTDDALLGGSIRDRAKASITFFWLDENGRYEAPETQLILYPKYPEVRLSGFLKNCANAPSAIMRVRDEGRVLFLGIASNGQVFGHAVTTESPLAVALNSKQNLESAGVFLVLPDATGQSSRARLLSALTSICQKHWIASQKLTLDGQAQPYNARNGGGYTLEAELGISPNGYAQPDYFGWEIKQYGVGDFKRFSPKTPVTLLTPAPNGGIYRDEGFHEFMKRYGYADKSGVLGRVNFGGIYSCVHSTHANTGLRLSMIGFDIAEEKITDLNGGIVLLDAQDNVAALWRFTGIIEHWNRKHAQAAYIPSLFQTPPPEYKYGPQVMLCEGTDLSLFLSAIAAGTIFLDPGLKLTTTPNGLMSQKERHQFRIKHTNLGAVYHQTEIVRLKIDH